MKFLVLALVFSLICVSSQLDPAQVTGDWRTIYIAADNVEKVSEGGELRGYVYNLECSEGCNKLTISFYASSTGECQKYAVVGTNTVNNLFILDFSGKNFFQIKYVSDSVLGFYNQNVDQQGKVTHETVLLAKQDSVSDEEQQRYVRLTKEVNIPEENIRNVSPSETCPDA